MKISEILLKYETDKVQRPIMIGHPYGEFYDQLFEQYKDADLLEIGVERGGSLLAWKEYFPKGNIYGIDIVDVRKKEYISDSVNFILGDVKTIKLDKQFDIIIDDGSHFIEDVVFVVNNYLSLLKPNGVLIVEDVQDGQSWTIRLQSILPQGYSLDVRDFRPNNGYDDFLIIIKKT